MAPFTDRAGDSAAAAERGNDPAWTVRPGAGTEKPGDGADLDSFSRRAGADTPLRRQLFLPGVPFYGGAQRGAASFQALDELAASAAQQMGFRNAVCGHTFRLRTV